MDNHPLLAFCNFSSKWQNGLALHKNISFSLKEGENLALLGPSGSGKSSLINYCLEPLGNLIKTEGEVFCMGRNLANLTLPELRVLQSHSLAYVSQHSYQNLNPYLTLVQHLKMALKYRNNKEYEEQFIFKTTQELALKVSDLQKYPHQISMGMASRFNLMLALTPNPLLLIVDEVTANLDEENSEKLLQLLKKRQQEGLTLLLVSHHLTWVSQIARQFIKIEEGAVVENATFD